MIRHLDWKFDQFNFNKEALEYRLEQIESLASNQEFIQKVIDEINRKQLVNKGS